MSYDICRACNCPSFRCECKKDSCNACGQCESCIERSIDFAEGMEEVTCPACGGTGDAPDNGTNMGECDECCGTGRLNG